jgi:hypothetical protein
MVNFNAKTWYEDAYISVSQVGGSEVQMCSKTTTMEISGGNRDIEGINTFCGEVTRVTAQDDIEISFDGIPVSNADFDWIFHGVSNTSTSITTSTAVKERVTMLWTDQTGITAAGQAILTASEAYRRIYAESYCTKLEYSMDAGEHLVCSLGFKLAAEDANGALNYKMECCDTTSALAAVGAYTASNKF